MMRIHLSLQFSKEIPFEQIIAIKGIERLINDFFFEKEYGPISDLYIGVVCVSEKFEPFFPIRPIRMVKGNILEYEIKLDFDIFRSKDLEHQLAYTKDILILSTKEIFAETTLKDFDSSQFVNDLVSSLT